MLPDGVTVEVIVVNQVNAGHLFVQQHTHPTFHVLRSLDQQMYLCYSQPGIPTMPTPVEGKRSAYALLPLVASAVTWGGGGGMPAESVAAGMSLEGLCSRRALFLLPESESHVEFLQSPAHCGFASLLHHQCGEAKIHSAAAIACGLSSPSV